MRTTGTIPRYLLKACRAGIQLRPELSSLLPSLTDDEDEVDVGEAMELFEEILGEESDRVVLGRVDSIVGEMKEGGQLPAMTH